MPPEDIRKPKGFLPENIKKPKGFLMFSGGIEKKHRAVMG